MVAEYITALGAVAQGISVLWNTIRKLNLKGADKDQLVAALEQVKNNLVTFTEYSSALRQYKQWHNFVHAVADTFERMRLRMDQWASRRERATKVEWEEVEEDWTQTSNSLTNLWNQRTHWRDVPTTISFLGNPPMQVDWEAHLRQYYQEIGTFLKTGDEEELGRKVLAFTTFLRNLIQAINRDIEALDSEFSQAMDKVHRELEVLRVS